MVDGHRQRRRIRLAPERYADIDAVCSVTIAVKGRRPIFATAAVAAAAIDVLQRHAAANDVPIYAPGASCPTTSIWLSERHQLATS